MRRLTNIAEGRERIRFSWAGVLLAPLLVPALVSAALAGTGAFGGTGSRLLSFLVLLVPGSVIAYGGTICLLPCLWLWSAWRPLTWFSVCLLGLALGAAVVVALIALEWSSSGPDSGPPVEPFARFFIRFLIDPTNLLEPAAGMLTAAAYWACGTHARGISRSPRA